MLKVGLTGGVACGKSTVGQMFVRRGAHLIQADRIAHRLMQPGTAVYDQIVAAFGRGILDAEGNISRPKLADASFNSGRIDELNRIVHPAVIAEQDAWMERAGGEDRDAVTIVEAALILEAGAGRRFDKLITVTCTPEQRVQRFAERHRMSVDAARAEVQRRMAAQLPEEEKTRAADYVIDNSGPLQETEAQVERVYSELRQLALSR